MYSYGDAGHVIMFSCKAMDPEEISCNTFYKRVYKKWTSAIENIEDSDRDVDLVIIPPSPDYHTDPEDIDEDDLQGESLPADLPVQIDFFC